MGMKRYLMVTRKRYIEEDYSEMVECPEGNWVKWEDAEKTVDETFSNGWDNGYKDCNAEWLEKQTLTNDDLFVKIVELTQENIKLKDLIINM